MTVVIRTATTTLTRLSCIVTPSRRFSLGPYLEPTRLALSLIAGSGGIPEHVTDGTSERVDDCRPSERVDMDITLNPWDPGKRSMPVSARVPR
jgi:hypothetical protein